MFAQQLANASCVGQLLIQHCATLIPVSLMNANSLILAAASSHRIFHLTPSEHNTLTQCWVNSNAGLIASTTSTTLGQHWPSIDSTCRVCWEGTVVGSKKVTMSQSSIHVGPALHQGFQFCWGALANQLRLKPILLALIRNNCIILQNDGSTASQCLVCWPAIDPALCHCFLFL